MKEALHPSAVVPSVAALIACYNGGRFLRRAVRSLQRQTVPLSEILVVDDGSTDKETQKVLESLVEEGAIQCLRLEANQGLAAARNRGIERLGTDHILLLDCDDTYDPRFLEEALLRGIGDRVAGLGCYLQFYTINSNNVERRIKRWKPLGGSLSAFLFRPSISSCLLLNRAAWSEVGGYDEEMRLYEDWELWIRVTEAGWKLEAMPYFLYNYYVHGSNMSRDTSPEGLFRQQNALEYIYEKHQMLYRRHFYAAYRQIAGQLVRNPKLLFRPPLMLYLAGRRMSGCARALTELWAMIAFLIRRIFFIK